MNTVDLMSEEPGALQDAAWAAVVHANRVIGNYRDVVWLVGDGRSGTTWIASLLNHEQKRRELFEPFHPNLIDDMGFLRPHEYVRPGEAHARLSAVARTVFSGRFIHRRVDLDARAQGRSLHRGLLVKDIFVNLLCKWVTTELPTIRVVLLMRNPFAVALSKHKLENWDWGIPDARHLLRQDALRADHLAPFEDLIVRAGELGDPILDHLLVWCVLNYVPLRQFAPGELDILTYEQVFQDPIGALARLGISDPPPEEVIRRPSRVAGAASNVVVGTSPIDAFENELSKEQIDEGYRIMDAFGLRDLYADPRRPDTASLEPLRARG